MLGDGIYECDMRGSKDTIYHTYIDVSHPRKSQCNCPFADGRRVICKHMVALLFTVLPGEAEAYMHEIEESEKEAESFRIKHYEDMERYVNGLTKDDLQRKLLEALIELEERNNRYW